MAQIRDAAQMPALWETWVRSLGWEDLLEKRMEKHSSILAWEITWTEELDGLQSMGWQSWTQLSMHSTTLKSTSVYGPVLF